MFYQCLVLFFYLCELFQAENKINKIKQNYTLTAKDPKQRAFLRPSVTTWRFIIWGSSFTGISGQCVKLQIRNMLYVDICIYINIDVYLLLFLRLEEMSKSDLSAWRQRLASTCCVL